MVPMTVAVLDNGCVQCCSPWPQHPSWPSAPASSSLPLLASSLEPDAVPEHILNLVSNWNKTAGM